MSAPSDPVRWGILGAGRIARAFASDLRATGRDVVAVGARRAETATGFAAEFGVPVVHEGYRALVEDPLVDAVYIATPNSHHERHALLAIDAGKHVLVEKPFALDAASAARIRDRGAAAGVAVMEAMWTRFLPHMTRIRDLVRTGALGEVRAIVADHTQRLSADPGSRVQDPALGGGALLDLGVYPVSFAWDLLGAPDDVVARGALTATGVDRQSSILLSYGDGATAVLHSGLDTRGPNTATILGTDGWIAVDRTWYMPTTFTAYAADGSVVEEFDGRTTGRGMHFEALELERLIRTGATSSPVMPLDESVGIMGTLDEVRRQLGVDFPPPGD